MLQFGCYRNNPLLHLSLVILSRRLLFLTFIHNNVTPEAKPDSVMDYYNTKYGHQPLVFQFFQFWSRRVKVFPAI